MRKQYSATFKAAAVQELLKEEKTISQLAAEIGVHPSQLKEWKRIALQGLPALFSRESKVGEQAKLHEQQVNELYGKIGRLTTQVNWLKKNLAFTLSRSERLALVERDERELPLSVQADLLSLSRSSLYYQPVLPSAEEVTLKHRIDELYTAYSFYGSRRIAAHLRREGLVINRKTVQRHMREMGIAGICPGPNLSRRNQEHQVYPYLLRHVTAAYPNHVWGIDITYIRLQKSWLYLVAVLDWFSHYVVSWQLDDTLEIDFVLLAVDRALAQATPVIWNSDQGSHFTSPQYTQRLLAAEIQISMDGKGRALDNIFTERLWRSVKYEEVYLYDYQLPKQAYTGLATYFDFYNYRRPHQALADLTPAEVYFANAVVTPTVQQLLL
jgi:putative transposase